jgi:WD40 repeat protein
VKKMSSHRKTSSIDNELDAQEPTSQEIDVHTVQIPFFRVFPIYWVDYNAKHKLIAVSRGNSTIEIWSYPYWHLVTRVHLQREVSVRKCFIVERDGQPTFLVIVTSNSYVIVFDMIKGEFTQHLLHGGEFAFDADFEDCLLTDQPPQGEVKPEEEVNSRKSSKMFEDFDDILGRLVLACNDGAVRFYDLNRRGTFSLKFTTQAKNEKATSCTFSRGLKEAKNSFCVGYDSGDIRIFSYKTKQLVTLISGDKSKDNKSTVWALRTIAPHFIVSGTSEGAIKIHETKFGTLVKEIRDHNADILAITVSADHTRVFVSGADSQVVLIGKTLRDIEGLEVVEFKTTSKERGQSHDVYCIVELHADLVLSAGHSTDLCLYKIDNDRFADRKLAGMNKVKLRHITCVNAGHLVDYNSKSDLLLINSFRSVDIFAFQPNQHSLDYLANITVDEFTTRFTAVSQVASYFAIGTSSRIELFSYHRQNRTIARIPTDFSESGCKALAFGGQKLFFITEENPEHIQIYDPATLKLQKIEFEDLSSIGHIDLFKVSPEGDRVLVADKLNRRLALFSIINRTTMDLSNYRKVRIMDASMCKTTFSVYITYETNIVLKVNSTGKVVYFSSGKLPHDLQKTYDRYYGVLAHPGDKKKFLMHSLYSFIRVETSKVYTELEKVKDIEVLHPEASHERDCLEGHLRVVKSSKPIAGLLFAKNGLMMVTFDWKTAMSEIPDPVISKKFGL